LNWNARLKNNFVNGLLSARWVSLFYEPGPIDILHDVNHLLKPTPSGPVSPPTGIVDDLNHLFKPAPSVAPGTDPQMMENWVRSAIARNIRSDRSAVARIWAGAFGEISKAETSINRAARELDGMRSLINGYVSIVFADKYIGNDLGLVLAGMPSTRIQDDLVIAAVIRCVASPAEEYCKGDDIKSLVNAILKVGWRTALQDRSQKAHEFVQSQLSSETTETTYVLLDLTLARLELTLKGLQ
jgi:hypothetical protein